MILSWVPNILFRHQQVRVRKEMKMMIKNGVPEEKRILFYEDELNADASNLKWIHEREFQFRGEMYDILKREIRNGRLVYICVHDVKESGLFARLDEMVEKQMQSNEPAQTQQKRIKNFFSSLFFHADENASGLQCFVSEILFPEVMLVKDVFTAPDIPPPEVV